MPKSRSARPANRPSRRHEILASAVDLLAAKSPDEISVSDIATHCGMTSAAFYYHFKSKDEILDEIVTGFAARWTQCVEAALGDLSSEDDLPACIDDVLTWVEEHELYARVYFVTSIGATSSCEAIRRKTRNDLARRATRSFREITPEQDRIKIAIAGLGLITLLEVASRSRLDLDTSYRTLGPVRFRAATVQLAGSLLH